jgi:hypothetical protein
MLSSEYPIPHIIELKYPSFGSGGKDMCKECGCGCDCDSGCGCSCHQSHFERRYQTKAEKIAELESYLAELKVEVQAVEEHLADLRK